MRKAKTAYIRARIEPRVKAKAEAVFDELGVTPSQVINMLYKQVSRNHEVPLELCVPNKETKAAINEARKRKDTVEADDADDLFDKLDV